MITPNFTIMERNGTPKLDCIAPIHWWPGPLARYLGIDSSVVVPSSGQYLALFPHPDFNPYANRTTCNNPIVLVGNIVCASTYMELLNGVPALIQPDWAPSPDRNYNWSEYIKWLFFGDKLYTFQDVI